MTTTDLLSAYNVPPAWKKIRLRWLSKRYAGGTPDTKNPDYWENGAVPWLNSGSVNQGTIKVPSDYITELALKESSAKWIPAGSLVMALAGQGKTKATVGYLEIATTGNQSLAAIIPEKIYGKYLYWWLTSQYLTLRNLSSQDGRDGLNLEMIGSIVCPVPSGETQRRIAQFLDEKTARIDGLIDKKRDLLDRLAEKRQALITRAVTKGLNPNAPMKPSGIDWLGDIPAHWEVIPLKRAVRYQEGPGIMAVDFRDRGVPLLRVSSVGGRYATLDGANYLDPEMVELKWSHFLTDLGDLLISASATSGIVSEVTETTVGCVPYTGIIRINPIEGMTASSFIRHLLVSDVFLSQIDQLKAGSTIQHFGPYHLGLMVIACPPVHEQSRIGDELDKVLQKIDVEAEKIEKSVEILLEYRAALITAGVTGQIGGLQ